MRKKIIVSLVLGSVLASSMYAKQVDSEKCLEKDNSKHMCKQDDKNMMHGKKGHKMMKKHHGMKDSMSMNIMRAFKKLDLNDKQKEEIKTIVRNSFKKQKKINTVFTKSSFNKAEFIKQAMNKKENMIKLKANTIEKAYDVLSTKQKEQFKVLIDLNI